MNELNEQIAQMNKQAQTEPVSTTLGNIAGIAGVGTSIAADIAGGVAADVASDISVSAITDVGLDASLDVADGALSLAGDLLGGLFD